MVVFILENAEHLHRAIGYMFKELAEHIGNNRNLKTKQIPNNLGICNMTDPLSQWLKYYFLNICVRFCACGG